MDVAGTHSTNAPITCLLGVHSISSFIFIYVNDMTAVISNKLYADDSGTPVSGKNKSGVEEIQSYDMSLISD
jgi:hypothetical protein